MDLSQEPWWPEFVIRLRKEALTDLADVFGEDEADLFTSLSTSGKGGGATEADWWPEAERRARAGVGVRELARLFGTNPRRIRRALSREGIRAEGAVLENKGLPALAAFRDRLGKEPDSTVAEAAGVSADAVKGERRRLGIDAYTFEREPSPAPAAPRSEERQAKPAARRKERAPRSDSSEPTSKRPTEAPVRPRRRGVWRKSGEDLEVVRRPAARRVIASGESRLRKRLEPSSRDTPAEETSTEPDARATRQAARRGRMRIVRPEEQRDMTPKPEPVIKPPPKRRKRVASPHGEVKELDVSQVDVQALMGEMKAAGIDVRPAAEAADVLPRPATTRPASAPAPRRSKPAPLSSVLPSLADAGTAPAAVAEPAPAPTPAPTPAPAAPSELAPAPAAAAQLAPAPPRRRMARPPRQAATLDDTAPRYGWRVMVGDDDLPLVIVASDVAEAVGHLRGRVSADQLAAAHIYRVDLLG